MKKILLGAPVRQKKEIFEYYLDNIDRLEIPRGYELKKYFILHNSPELIPICENRGIHHAVVETAEPFIKDEQTHHWTDQNVTFVTWMKNILLNYTAFLDCDYYFLVDSDLMLQPKTLKALLQADKDITCEAFWTRWSPDKPAYPNAWAYDSYTLTDEDMKLWRKPGLYKCGMSGACALIKRKVIDAGVNYSPVYNISWNGEDRHFCIKAAAMGFEIWLDTHYPPYHIYRDTELQTYKQNFVF